MPYRPTLEFHEYLKALLDERNISSDDFARIMNNTGAPKWLLARSKTRKIPNNLHIPELVSKLNLTKEEENILKEKWKVVQMMKSADYVRFKPMDLRQNINRSEIAGSDISSGNRDILETFDQDLSSEYYQNYVAGMIMTFSHLSYSPDRNGSRSFNPKEHSSRLMYAFKDYSRISSEEIERKLRFYQSEFFDGGDGRPNCRVEAIVSPNDRQIYHGEGIGKDIYTATLRAFERALEAKIDASFNDHARLELPDEGWCHYIRCTLKYRGETYDAGVVDRDLGRPTARALLSAIERAKTIRIVALCHKLRDIVLAQHAYSGLPER